MPINMEVYDVISGNVVRVDLHSKAVVLSLLAPWAR